MVKNARKEAAHRLGAEGEALVAEWYRERGFRIVDRNWRCFEGEIDVIACGQSTLVFCEVKSRSSDRFADPALAVDWRKQAKVKRAAFRWLEEQPWQDRLRFDVALVVRDEIRVIENAF